MSRELKAVVVVDGVVYGPGYETPDERVAARIKNPAAWGEQVESDEGHGVPGDHEQLAAGLLPHAPVQPNQVALAEPAGDGGINPLLPPSTDTGSSAVPAGAATPSGIGAPPVPPDEQPGVLLTDRPALGGGERADDEPVAGQPAPELPEPPRSGKGASSAAWRTYAAQFGVELDEDADRGAIIERLKHDGHIQ